MNLIKHRRIFGTAGTEPGRLVRSVRFSVRLFTGILANFRDEKLHLQSASLAYTTLLSLIPLLAITFSVSVLKGFGVQNQLEPMLMQSLEPLGDKGAEIGRHILTYRLIAHADGGGLQRHLARTRRRSWTRRFSDYLSVALVGPVFVFTALGVTAIAFRAENIHGTIGIEPLDQLIIGLGRLVPYLLVCLAFAFLYAFLTNYRGLFMDSGLVEEDDSR